MNFVIQFPVFLPEFDAMLPGWSTRDAGPSFGANWPAMTMSFKLANPSSVSGIEAGQRVHFQFTIAGGMDATVTEIERVE